MNQSNTVSPEIYIPPLTNTRLNEIGNEYKMKISEIQLTDNKLVNINSTKEKSPKIHNISKINRILKIKRGHHKSFNSLNPKFNNINNINIIHKHSIEHMFDQKPNTNEEVINILTSFRNLEIN